ncbi:MAG TPA: hypothetical protein VGJ20_38190 [Xanthobacteraceae bacterium]
MIAISSTWTYDNNFTGWSALLSERLGDASNSPAAVPARLDCSFVFLRRALAFIIGSKFGAAIAPDLPGVVAPSVEHHDASRIGSIEVDPLAVEKHVVR